MSWHCEGRKHGRCASIPEAGYSPSNETVISTRWTSQCGPHKRVKRRVNWRLALAYRPSKYARRDYLVVLETHDEVRDLAPDFATLGQLDIGIGGVIVTAPGDGTCDYVARFFAPSVGIPEDPVTGSIQCSLAHYWTTRLGTRTFRVRQLSARGGELRCRMEDGRVKVAGQARLYMHGHIEL